MDYRELIERLRYERDDGSRDEAANAIESLQAELTEAEQERKIERNLRIGVENGFDCANEENGRLKAWVEQLKAELAKYRDAPVVVWRIRPYDYGIGHEGVYAFTHFKDQSKAWKAKGWRVEELIVKPGE